MMDSRFTLLQTPILAPGTCLLTGSTGPVVDTGISVEWFPANALPPRVYLSVDVIRELAEVAGVRTVASVQERLNDVQTYNRGYMDAVKERVGDQLVELVDRLGLLTALLGADARADLDGHAEFVTAGAAAGAGVPDSAPLDAGEPGQGDGAGRKRRRADVSGNPAA